MDIRSPNEAARKILSATASALLAVIWATFAYRHVNAFDETGEAALLLFCISESVQAALFLARWQPVTVSVHPFDWLVAICGTFGPFFFVPLVSDAPPAASVLVTAGVILQIVGLASLNRSFGIVPARRRIRTGGLYRLVRHPMYASYFVLLTGYVAANASAWNGIVCMFTLACLVLRMFREEHHLRADPAYVRYMERVRYRVVPLLF